ncbi:hypothetical protein [Streptomyces rectiverticillatus]|uniref:hypothetical protein n=1 Tax=Streptomyces rectiverticillatus TaxID=173860 RepID=UPI001FE7668B|nr:hypothetical protein [Streptomyces rectiverticillatus]
MALTLSACGSDDKEEKPESGRSAQQDGPGKDDGRSEQESQSKRPDDTKVIATLKGPKGIVLDITSVTRSSGGFVTLNGNLKNTSDEKFYDTQVWSGPELNVIRGAGGSSLGGATLVDEKEKKRYYTLRDTENRPLATTGIPVIDENSEQKVYMQFPAPPKSTTQVDLQIPTFQSVVLTLTDG